MLVSSVEKNIFDALNLASLFTKETLISHSKMLDNSYYTMQRGGGSKRMIAEMALIRMCDEALDTSSEAILSRLSKLEDSVRLASFAPQRPAEPIEVIEDKPEAEVKKDEIKAEPKTEAVKRPTVSDGGKPKLRTIRCKMEVAEKLSMTDIPAASFLKSAKMFEDENGGVLIKLSNDFAVSMLSKPKTKEALLASLSEHLQASVLPVDPLAGLVIVVTVDGCPGDAKVVHEVTEQGCSGDPFSWVNT